MAFTNDTINYIDHIQVPGSTISWEIHDGRVDALGSYLVFKGTVDTKEDLPDVATKGWIYIVTEDSSEWVCTKDGTGASDPATWEKFGAVGQTGLAYFGTTAVPTGKLVKSLQADGKVVTTELTAKYSKADATTGAASAGTQVVNGVTIGTLAVGTTATSISVTGSVSGTTGETAVSGTISKVITTIGSGTFLTTFNGSTSEYTPEGTISSVITTISSTSDSTSVTPITNVGTLPTKESVNFATDVKSTSFTGTAITIATANALTGVTASNITAWDPGAAATSESVTYATGAVTGKSFTGSNLTISTISVLDSVDASKITAFNGGTAASLSYAAASTATGLTSINGQTTYYKPAGEISAVDRVTAVGTVSKTALASATVSDHVLVISDLTFNAVNSVSSGSITPTFTGTSVSVGNTSFNTDASKITKFTANTTASLTYAAADTTSKVALTNATAASGGFVIKPSGSIDFTLTTTTHNMITGNGSAPSLTYAAATSSSVSFLKSTTTAGAGFIYTPAGTVGVSLNTSSHDMITGVGTLPTKGAAVKVITAVTPTYAAPEFTGASVAIGSGSAAKTPTYAAPTFYGANHTHSFSDDFEATGTYTKPTGSLTGSISVTNATVASSSHTHTLTYTGTNATITLS